MTIRSLLLIAALPVALAAQQSGWTPAPPVAPAAPAPSPVPPVPSGASTAPTPRALVASTWAQSADEARLPRFAANFPQDPADSVYRAARTQLNRGEWRRSATLFGQVAARQPASAYAADALYWQAFALYRIGGVTELREALTALDARKSRFPRAGNAEEAEQLATRVAGALAARGDATARGRVQSQATASTAGSCDSEELSVRASALSQLMRNDPAAATPILSRVLDRRDDCSVSLRSSAVHILGRKDDAAARAKLLDVARNDPAASVRIDAIGYLAEANSDDVVATLDGIVRTETDANVQRSAVRTLGSMTNPKAKSAIRALVERTTAPERLRVEAIGSFDRRAGVSTGLGFSYSCAGDCAEVLRAEQFGQSLNALTTVPVAPAAPPAPIAPAARPAPAPRPAPTPRAMASAEARYEAEAVVAEERAAALADARAAGVRAGQRPLAYTVSGDGFGIARWDEDDRRISPEDAAWLRGVYPKLETSRLKSAAAAVLARSGDEATTNWLTQMVQREEEPAEVRASILPRLGRDLPIAQLGRLYDGASSRSMRSEIVSLLGRREEPEATDKLIEIVRTGTDPQLRRAAIGALNNKKDPRTTQLLLELIDK